MLGTTKIGNYVDNANLFSLLEFYCDHRLSKSNKTHAMNGQFICFVQSSLSLQLSCQVRERRWIDILIGVVAKTGNDLNRKNSLDSRWRISSILVLIWPNQTLSPVTALQIYLMKFRQHSSLITIRLKAIFEICSLQPSFVSLSPCPSTFMSIVLHRASLFFLKCSFFFLLLTAAAIGIPGTQIQEGQGFLQGFYFFKQTLFLLENWCRPEHYKCYYTDEECNEQYINL